MINFPEKDQMNALRQMFGGYARTQELYTTVKLGIPDHLANGPKKGNDLAIELKVNPQSLFRFLRLLVVRKILCEDGDNGYRLTPMGDLLRSDHPQSLRNIILYDGEVSYRVGQGMLFSVQTGKTAFDEIFGMPFFDYLSEHPDIGYLFNDLMSSFAPERAEAVVKKYNFDQAETIVDIGGGKGSLLAFILEKCSKVKGIVFDIPTAAAEAKQYLADKKLSDRCQVIPGDFFKDEIPAGKDIYILSNIIDDWDDKSAQIILGNCKKAMDGKSKLLLIENIMPDNIADGTAVVGIDMNMLLLTGGAARTLQEYKILLAQAGLEIVDAIPFDPMRNFTAGKTANCAIIVCTR